MNNYRVYTAEIKEQCVKEAKDIGSISAVAKKHQIPLATLHRWVAVPNSRTSTPVKKVKASKEEIALRKKLADAELENKVLKELLKKTNLAWLKD